MYNAFNTPYGSTFSFDQQARDDFYRAMRRGFVRRLVSRITRRSNDLLAFSAVLRCLKSGGRRDLGVRAVRLDQIIGSVGRFTEFDRAFLPRAEQTINRWTSIDRAYYQGIALPPVKLYKIGSAYFVEDGNHRISVARLRGQEYIEAYVTEIDAPGEITPQTIVNALCGCPPSAG